MNNIHTHSHTKPNPIFVGSSTVLLKIVFVFAFIFTASTLVPSHVLAWACTVSASASTIEEGTSITISWTTISSTSFSINNGIGDVTPVSAGSVTISPATTTTYIGTAHGPDGSTTCKAEVFVTSKPPPPPPPLPPPTCTLSASPPTVQGGSSSTLSWTTTNATAFSIDNSIGNVTPVDAGSTIVSPTASTTYTGTVTGKDGSLVTCPTTITVTPLPPPPPPPPPNEPVCTLSANPTSVALSGQSTLTWTTTNAISFSINNGVGSTTPVAGGATSTPSITAGTTFIGSAIASNGHTANCTATVTVVPPPPPPPPTGCTSGCGGGGGGGSPSPHILLAALAHAGTQPLAYLYLSQIPYTGLDLGPIGTIVYWGALVALALALAYLVLFEVVPFANRSLQNVGSRIKEALDVKEAMPALAYIASTVDEKPVIPPIQKEDLHEAPRGYSAYEGFKSFAREGSLSIEDIVKGLARSHSVPTIVEPKVNPIQNVEPIYENVEPIYENIDIIMNETSAETISAVAAPTHVRGFVAALIQGDRAAVFAGLRQHTRGGGASEKLISEIACLLDDEYRARLDGTRSDADITRLVARLDTPTLEKLVASLTTAIDSSYSAGATGAKIALTRALGVLGA